MQLEHVLSILTGDETESNSVLIWLSIFTCEAVTKGDKMRQALPFVLRTSPDHLSVLLFYLQWVLWLSTFRMYLMNMVSLRYLKPGNITIIIAMINKCDFIIFFMIGLIYLVY